MLDKNKIPAENLNEVKRHLQITWNDTDTTESLISMMLDGEIELNHLFGAELDYFAPGLAHRLYLSYMLYAYNKCLDEWEGAYRVDILKLQHICRVKEARNAKEQV